MNISSVGNYFMFTGREWDNELELYYYRARCYDPEAGRFINPDLLTWAPNDPRSRKYTSKDPIYIQSNLNPSSGISSLTQDIVLSNIVRGIINNRGALNPSFFNLYTYVENNPVNWIDPLELQAGETQVGGSYTPNPDDPNGGAPIFGPDHPAIDVYTGPSITNVGDGIFGPGGGVM